MPAEHSSLTADLIGISHIQGAGHTPEVLGRCQLPDGNCPTLLHGHGYLATESMGPLQNR